MFFLCDCNNFFVSCEIIFNPKIKNKAVVVLSNNDGCVVSRSEKAKELKINMGDPIFYHKKLVDSGKLIYFSSNFTLYGDISNRVMQTLKSFDLPIEIYSIDEAFINILNVENLKFENLAIEIKKRVKKWIGIDISIGIAPTKTLAKVANKFAKKNYGVFSLISNREISESLKNFKIEDVWGIGKQLSKKLKGLGIRSADDFIKKDQTYIKILLGINGLKTYLELKKTNCFEIFQNPNPKKSIRCSRSFYEKISDKEKLLKLTSSFAANACKKLRDENLLTTHVTVFIATSPYDEKRYFNSESFFLPNPTSYTPDILKFTKFCFLKIFKENFEYKKVGVILSNFVNEKIIQQDLFSQKNNFDQENKAKNVLDKINRNFEKNKIFYAQENFSKNDFSKSDNKTQNFTTSWKDLLIVN